MDRVNRTKGSVVPSLTLMILAPLIAEVLPGSTRFSALFVLPIRPPRPSGRDAATRNEPFKLDWIEANATVADLQRPK